MNSLNKMSSQTQVLFVCRLNGCGAQLPTTLVVSAASASSAVVRQKPQRPTGPRKPPEAERRSTSRRITATSRLQSSCSRKEPRWTPRTTGARGLGGTARNPGSNLGHLNKIFAIEIHEKNVCSTCGTLLQMEHKSPDGPLSRMLQSIHSKLF